MSNRVRLKRLWLASIAGANLLGIACLCIAGIARGQPAARTTARLFDAADLLDSAAFALMLPGSFFAAAVVPFARLLDCNDALTRVVWPALGCGINLTAWWRWRELLAGVGRTIGAKATPEREAKGEELSGSVFAVAEEFDP